MSSDTPSDRDGTVVEKVAEHGITTTREFAAAPATVFRAMHEPDLIAQWMGPEYLTCEEVTAHNEHGGTWTLVHRDPDGNEYAFRGVTHGEPSVDGSFRTFEWLGMPGHVSFERLTFEDLGGDRTRVHGIALYTSAEDRDGMFDTMGDGGYSRLDGLLPTL